MLFVQILEACFLVNNKFGKTAPTVMVQYETKILNFLMSKRQPPSRLSVLTNVWLTLQIYTAKWNTACFFLTKQLDDIAKYSMAFYTQQHTQALRSAQPNAPSINLTYLDFYIEKMSTIS